MSAHAANMVGTPSSVVTPRSRTCRSEDAGSKRVSNTNAAPVASDSPSATFRPKMWNSGRATIPTSSARRISGMRSICCRLAVRLPWVSMAALGSPAVPDVNSRTARSDSARSTGCRWCSSSPAPTSLHPALRVVLRRCRHGRDLFPGPSAAWGGPHRRARRRAATTCADARGPRPTRAPARITAGSTTSSSRPSSLAGLLGLRGTATAPDGEDAEIGDDEVDRRGPDDRHPVVGSDAELAQRAATAPARRRTSPQVCHRPSACRARSPAAW